MSEKMIILNAILENDKKIKILIEENEELKKEFFELEEKER